jgi:hypothetical protein
VPEKDELSIEMVEMGVDAAFILMVKPRPDGAHEIRAYGAGLPPDEVVGILRRYTDGLQARIDGGEFNGRRT